ncbi:MAG: TRAP transporter large permease subunit [Magnetospirillum sp.]|nr:TRAP transporter large permease subunit [Magnetospirillum sp.]
MGAESHLLGEILSVGLFATIVGLLMLGFPVAFSLGGISLFFAWIGWSLGVFDLNFLNALPTRFFGTMTNEVLVAVPLFVFMGVMLERSKIAEVLLTTMGQLFGGVRGGLGYSVIIVGTLLAASTGIVGATVVTMGLLSLPAMLRAGYDPKLATGIICASGTLGQIIPPSTVLIFIGDILQGANQQAQLAMGNFAPTTVSVGDLFAGAFIPGLMLSGLYMSWVFVRGMLDRNSCPPLLMTAEEKAGLGRRVIIALIPPIFLIVAVLGSILGGVATPTESASVGALGAIFLTVVKLLADKLANAETQVQLERQLAAFWVTFIAALSGIGYVWGATGLLSALLVVIGVGSLIILAMSGTRGEFLSVLRQVSISTMTITSMVFVILMGASVFSLVFRGLGGEYLVHDALDNMPGGDTVALVVVMAVMFALGFFLDTFEIIFITVPIAGPILLQMGFDAVWLGVLMGVNLQTSFLTPPFGFALFYLRGVAPPSITTQIIYRGVIPFVAIQIFVMLLMWFFPALATWLPNEIYGVDPNNLPTYQSLPTDFLEPPDDPPDDPPSEDEG